MVWLVGITAPNREEYAQLNVERLGVNTYLPKFEERFVSKDKSIRVRDACLFPRYLFIETDGTYYFLLDLFGMAGVARHESTLEPVVVPQKAIEALQGQEDERGYIVLPPHLSRRYKPPRRFRKGQHLRVNYGPFVGLEGVCQSDDASSRVKVLLSFLGAQRQVEVERSALLSESTREVA